MTVPLGSIIYLTTCVIRAQITAEKTMPDTPDVYGAQLEIMDDRGAMDLSALAGKPGPDGQVQFGLRRQQDISVVISDPEDFSPFATLPHDLADDDKGKYWVVTMRNAAGTLTKQAAFIWYGTADQPDTGGWREVKMGTDGPAGPIPRIRPTVTLISPTTDSYMDTGGTTLTPHWGFNLAVQPGPSQEASPLALLPDYDGVPAPTDGMVLMCSSDTTEGALPIWRPANVLALSPRVYSVPESSFTSLNANFDDISADQRVQIAAFAVPPQPFSWTPIVWGHVAGTRRVLLAGADQALKSQAETAVNDLIQGLQQGLQPPDAFDLKQLISDIAGLSEPPDWGPFNAVLAALQATFAGIAAGITANLPIIGAVVETLADTIVQVVGQVQGDAGQPLYGAETGIVGVRHAMPVDQGFVLPVPAMRIGCRVVLGPGRRQVARGFGNGRAQVNIMPHYSTPTRRTRSITPTNRHAVVPANHTDAAEGTVYVELVNDGVFGSFNFDSANSQLLVLVAPIDAYDTYAPTTRRLT